jgi:hypothetical protein
MKQFLFLIFIAISLTSCALLKEEANQCANIFPEDFKEADLIGTWYAGYPDQNDTLIIQENGLYMQTSYIETPRFLYMGEWLPWRVEYSEDGLPYLHLEGMNLCAYDPGLVDCEKPGGGESTWYDFCVDEFVSMVDEGILIVLGVTERYQQSPPRGIQLHLLSKHIEGAWVYNLVNP